MLAVVAPGHDLEHGAWSASRLADALASSRTSGSGLATIAAIRSARSGASGCRRGSAGACARRRRPRRGCGAAAAGRTSGTRRCGPGRRPPGSAAGWRRPAGPAPPRRPRCSSPPGGASPSHCCSSAVTTAASAPARCCARKIRNTASSSSGVRSRSVDAVVRERPASRPGTSRAARPARRRGSAGRCGSARGGCAPGVSAVVSSPAGRLRLSSDRSAKTAAGRLRPPAAGRGELRARGQVVGERPALVARVDVEAEQQAAQVLQAALRPAARRTAVRLGGQVQVDRSAAAAAASVARRRAAPAAAAARRSRPGCRPRPALPHPRANGARSTVSIFMLSSTSTGAPASTSSPAATGVATTSAGAGERTTPPSSRLTRWVTPSTSTRWTGPCVPVTRRNRWP